MSNTNFNKARKCLLNNMKREKGSKRSNSASNFNIGNDNFLKSKASQITLFVILSILVVIAIILLYIFVIKPYIDASTMGDPKTFIEKCATDSIKNSEKKIFETNAYPGNMTNYILYRGEKDSEKVPYLCTTSLFYEPCINQEPMLIEKIRKYIEENVKKDVGSCFSNLENKLKKGGRNVISGNLTVNIEFGTKAIIANITKDFTISKGSKTETFSVFDAKMNSPLYNLLYTENKIVYFESDLCAFDSVSWMRFNQDIFIKKFSASDQTKIYTLTDKDSEKKIKFAVKTCVLPAGM